MPNSPKKNIPTYLAMSYNALNDISIEDLEFYVLEHPSNKIAWHLLQVKRLVIEHREEAAWGPKGGVEF